ncbi:hypothetical protein Gbth_041_025 [Gluconobacter thailandicus F149-1 = NBRC 100600]|uniref:chorismate--pyruvate lyase family protein n=1 Tax=Gluconobacter thailandicus TaxID=257438 RepID=UPI0005DEF77A|nr:hypothetical protein [Gluconobacter thailandicus]GAN93929.1 hypothetical protein Gbth_041_025 [Gluconobacter thailandicus F149-1 = NBRC 100600]GEL87155.1 hypothetical protein GTH01_15130 [Gluconobacter thailandicus F149-1 = NBRC 100600]
MTSKSRLTRTTGTTTKVVRALSFAAALSGCAGPGDASSPDGAAVRALNDRLERHPSATAVLQEHCGLPIRVVRLPAQEQPSGDILLLLDVQKADQIRTRHVQLLCGDIPLSDAWNWYVPERLTADMNHVLETTDTPFGKAVADTHFHRQRLESHFPDPATGIVLENRAMLRRASDNAPISLVVEDYLPAALKPQP